MRARRHRDGIIVAIQARRRRERGVVASHRWQVTRAMSRRKPCFRRCLQVVTRRDVQRAGRCMRHATRARIRKLVALALRRVNFAYISRRTIDARRLSAPWRNACMGIDSARSDGRRTIRGDSRRFRSRRFVTSSGRSGRMCRCRRGTRGGNMSGVTARRVDRRALVQFARRQITARAIPRDGSIRRALDIPGTAMHVFSLIRSGIERHLGRCGERRRRSLSRMVRHQPRNRGHATDCACAARKRVPLTALTSRRAHRMTHAQWNRAGHRGRCQRGGGLSQTVRIPTAHGADSVGTQAKGAQHRGVQRLQFRAEADIGRQQRPFAAERARYQLKRAKARHSDFADY